MGWFKKKQEYNWHEAPPTEKKREVYIVEPQDPSATKMPDTIVVQPPHRALSTDDHLELAGILKDIRSRLDKLEGSKPEEKKELSEEEKEALIVEAVKDTTDFLDDPEQQLDEDMKRITASRVYAHYKKK